MTTSIHPNLGGLFIAQTPILNHTKLDMHKQKNKGGRPQKITNTVLRKLEGAFMDGMTDKEAAYLADIAPSTLYEYCKLHPAFSERKEVLKHHPTIAAKRVVIKAINNGDKQTARWWLERRVKKDFSLRHDYASTYGEQIEVVVRDFTRQDFENSQHI